MSDTQTILKNIEERNKCEKIKIEHDKVEVPDCTDFRNLVGSYCHDRYLKTAFAYDLDDCEKDVVDTLEFKSDLLNKYNKCISTLK
jgi:hypothetical protein